MLNRIDIAEILTIFENELQTAELLLDDTEFPAEETEAVESYSDTLSQIVVLLEKIHDPPLKCGKAVRILSKSNAKRASKGYVCKETAEEDKCITRGGREE